MQKFPPILESISKKGYFEFSNHYLDETFYASLYHYFDEVVNLVKNDKKFINANLELEKYFTSSAKNMFFADVTLGWNILKSPK